MRGGRNSRTKTGKTNYRKENARDRTWSEALKQTAEGGKLDNPEEDWLMEETNPR